MKICYTNRGLLMLTREEIQMSEQQFTDFFDPEIQKIVSEDGCSIYRMKNVTGEGVITRYEILPGIELFYNDFHMSDEALIQEAMAKVIAGKTVLMIAHRLSTITDADKIVVIKDGQIIDEGTHENLLTSCTLYQEMWKAHMDTKDVA